jgi:formylglycine-generating enzyme required for sulfatase activity
MVTLHEYDARLAYLAVTRRMPVGVPAELDARDAAAWFEGNSGVNGVRQTHPVGLKSANGFGLSDMLGNVFEWTDDWFAPYPLGDASDPSGPVTGQVKVYRGGAWGFVSGEARSAFRGNVFVPNQRSYWVGVRAARSVGP